MLSYWEKDSLLNYDYIVVGGGIVGLSTSVSIKEMSPQSSVLVLEREVIPTGASTKNAGFATVGSLTEILDDLKTMPKEVVSNLVKTRREGLKLLRERLGDENIGYKENGSYELISKDQLWALPHIQQVNDMLRDVLEDGGDAFTLLPDQEIDNMKFNRDYTLYLIKNNYEAELNTGMMIKSYYKYAQKLGVEIKNAPVISFNDMAADTKIHNGTSDIQRQQQQQQMENGYNVKVVVKNNTLDEYIEFKCKKLAICTNAFTNEILQGASTQVNNHGSVEQNVVDVVPGRGQVIYANNIQGGVPFKGIYHFDEGYYYFRELNGGILFGGGRNMDVEGETSTQFKSNKKILDSLEEYLRKVIIPNRSFTIQHRWTGIMAFGKDKKPIIKNYTPNIYLGVRMGGMGVAIGSLVGKQVASMMLTNNNNNNNNNNNQLQRKVHFKSSL